MKKYSRSAHTAVSELNITPLLDLAFVLLVIFIITTAPIVNDLEMDLPLASKNQKDPKPKVNYVTVDKAGRLFLNRSELELSALLPALTELRKVDEDLNIVLRSDGKAHYKFVVPVLDVLQQAKIGKVNLATDPGN